MFLSKLPKRNFLLVILKNYPSYSFMQQPFSFLTVIRLLCIVVTFSLVYSFLIIVISIFKWPLGNQPC